MNALNYSAKSEAIEVIYNAAISKMLGKSLTNDERKLLGHSLKEILFKCTFNNAPCSSEDFIWKFDRFYGNCFVFNSGLNQSDQSIDLKNSLLAGSSYGLSVDFYIGLNENLTLFNSIYGRGGFVKVIREFFYFKFFIFISLLFKI